MSSTRGKYTLHVVYDIWKCWDDLRNNKLSVDIEHDESLINELYLHCYFSSTGKVRPADLQDVIAVVGEF